MSDQPTMSYREFGDNKQAILAAVDALVNTPKSRKRFRALDLYEETTGERLAEVFRTPYGPIVVYRSRGRVSRGRRSGTFYRQGRGLDDLIIAPLTGDPDQRFLIVAATSADRSISGRDLAQWLAEGKTRRTISQPSKDDRPLSPTAQLAQNLANNIDAIAANPRAGEIYQEVDQMTDEIIRVLNRE